MCLVLIEWNSPPIDRVKRKAFENIKAQNHWNLRRSSYGNAIAPFHLYSNFRNAQVDCSHGNGTIAH